MQQCIKAVNIRVLIVDDFSLVREGIANALAEHPEIEVVGRAADGREALERGHELHPDVVLLDLGMPEHGGMEALYAYRRELPEARVLVLTANENPEVLLDAVTAGAVGYLTKRATVEELCEAVVAVHHGGSVVTPCLAAHLMREYAAASRGEASPLRPRLTGRERTIVHLVSRGLTDKEIAEQLFVSPRTVGYHLTKIRQKTGVSRRSQIARWAVTHSLG